MPTQLERKLTTILCADVAGYSRLMEQDEVGTLQSLKKAREIIIAEIETHSGRLINMVGDAVIADFASVVNAVHCSVAVQNKLQEHRQSQTNEVPLSFRIGLNLGDVIIEGDDIFGDGVNIAARLEGLAPQDGVCISGTVYDHVKGKFPMGFNFLGEKKVKNIEEAISVYSLELNLPQQDTDREAPATPKFSDSEMDFTASEEIQLRKQVKRQANFYRRAMMTGSLILFLFLINILSSPGYLWFIWPALPMFLILALDAMRVFGKGQFASDWEDRKLMELKNQKRRHKQ